MVDKTGRIANPKSPRQKSRLSFGHPREIVEERGVAVFYSGQPLTVATTNGMLKQIREERDRANLGRHE